MNTEPDIRNRIVEILDVPGSLVLPNPANWRTHPESQTSALRGILASVGVVDVLKVVKHPKISGSYMLIDGHARAEILGDRNVKVAVLDLSEEEQRLVLATFDPVGNLAGTDQEMLDSLLDGLNVEDAALLSLLEGIHSFDPGEILSDSVDGTNNTPPPTSIENKLYTQKVAAPIYEPKNEKPAVSTLYDTGRSVGLIQAIQKADIPQEEKDFLIAAARRHVVFNYHNIADYYAHSSPPIQRLMEDSALVIIDYNRAIELGYVKVSEAVDAQRAEEYPDGGGDSDD